MMGFGVFDGVWLKEAVVDNELRCILFCSDLQCYQRGIRWCKVV